MLLLILYLRQLLLLLEASGDDEIHTATSPFCCFWKASCSSGAKLPPSRG